jgi:uncharacterized membrane protein
MKRSTQQRPVVAAGMTLGIGLGGFVDGIVFHQLLQFHSMLSARYPLDTVVNLEINMFWDGLFHAFCWLMTALGLGMLWRVAQQRNVPLVTSTFVGSLLVGWAVFNLVEGLIDHHWLHIHHVLERPNHLPWDLGFLGASLVLLVIGSLLIRHATAGSDARTETVETYS